MNKYKLYKPSDVEWIGDIPQSWEVFKLGNLFSVNGRVGWKNLRSDEYIDEPNFIFLSTPNLKYKNIDFDNVNYITQFRYDESPEIKLQIDDIILVKSGSTLGIVNIVRNLPKPSTVNGSSVILRKKNTNELSSFYHYFFSSHYFQNLMSVTQGGVGVPSVNQSDINNFKLSTVSVFVPIPKYRSLPTRVIPFDLI
jgi:type I restriction enzyme S subunit